jgi:2-oxo-3-hexenedioate decarboxylase
MKLDHKTILALAEHLENAELKARDVTMITGEHPDMDWDDAYAIQDEIKRRKEARGHKTVGLKAGLTSFAKMKQMGVETPVFGFVSDYMARPDGGEIKIGELIHPKVEAEICIVTKAPLSGPGCNVAAVMAATDFVVPAVEIIDSRYRDFKFDLKSVIADNTSSSRFVIGGRSRDLQELDLRTLGGAGDQRGDPVDGRRRRRAGQPAGGRRDDGQPPRQARPAHPGRHLRDDRRRHRGDPGQGGRQRQRALPGSGQRLDAGRVRTPPRPLPGPAC